MHEMETAEPSVEDISRETGLDAKLISDLLAVSSEMMSFDSPVKKGEDGSSTYGDFLEDESAGRRSVPFSREIFIERTDFMEEPPKKYYRLSPGKEVRLRYAYLIRCDEVIKNDAGEIVELASREDLFLHATHPYTLGLFDSLPSMSGDVDRLNPIPGLTPDPENLPEGCHFHPRCRYATEECKKSCPSFVEVSSNHYVRCHLAKPDNQTRQEG